MRSKKKFCAPLWSLMSRSTLEENAS